ncbi:MAG: Holliday junction branch migration DNA helicase RuvB [Bdellovibrionaceae bacterium]|nr:Holliday junction branch migration DNA helicase RuvB [Pseudobdellovibrionaceae bacterium]
MNRVIQSEMQELDLKWENKLRPQSFEEFPGQKEVKEKLRVFVQAAKKRGEPLDHTLLFGPPGLGKTTLAQIVAHELGVDIKITSAPAIDKKGDLAAILTSLKPFSVLFIDEIHRLPRVIEEYLYTAMEDYYIDIVTGEGLGTQSMKFQLVPFTLIGATTRAGLLDNPFRDRFGIQERLQFYDREALKTIIERSAGILNLELESDAASEVARRARGTPRVANRLLKRVRDYADVKGDGRITNDITVYALDQLGVDKNGLDEMDRRILKIMAEKYEGGPVGIETLSAALGEESETLEEVYEPFLIQEGFIQKTSRGRVLTQFSKQMNLLQVD